MEMDLGPATALVEWLSAESESVCVYLNVLCACQRTVLVFACTRVCVCVTGFISLQQRDRGRASHPIIWPRFKRDHRRVRERFHLISLNGDWVACGFLCGRMSIMHQRKSSWPPIDLQLSNHSSAIIDIAGPSSPSNSFPKNKNIQMCSSTCYLSS